VEENQGMNYVPVSKKRRVNLKKLILVGVISISIFTLGILIGDGRLTLNRGQQINPVAKSNTDNLSTAGVQEIYDLLKQKYDGEIIPEDLLDGLKAGVVSAVGDTYTRYLNAKETKEFNSDLNGTFEGIGAELSKEGEFVVIVAPIKGTPADKAGIRPGDVIVKIDGEDSTNITVYEAVKRIRGEKGTEVVLDVVRNGEGIKIPIIRDSIDIPSVKWRTEGDVGIIEISRFGNDTSTLAKKAAQEFKDAGIKKVVLDLRSNPGGLLDEAVKVSSIWLERGSTVLEEKRGGQTINTFRTSSSPILSGVKTIVLIDEGSASASEIVAGALKDNGVATLLGKTSFGKGSVQQLIDLDGGGSLKVTIARWYTPGGKNIDKEGIDPDVSVELTPENRANKQDPQLDEAKKLL